MADRLDGIVDDGALAAAGIAKEPEYLLQVRAVLEPIHDGADGVRLLRGWGEAHGLASQQWVA